MENDPLWLAITAKQHDDLLNITNGTQSVTQSVDFNTSPVLVDGMIKRFMGFNFIHTERLVLDAGSDRLCPAWAQSGMHLCTWNALNTKITERPDKSDTQIAREFFGESAGNDPKSTKALARIRRMRLDGKTTLPART